MQFRITKENILTLSSLGVTDGSSFNKLLKKVLSDTDNVSVPLSSSDRDECIDNGLLSILEKIYDDTQKIVGEIEKKKIKPDGNHSSDSKSNSSSNSNVKDNMSDTQSIRYNSTYEKYKTCFKDNKSRGTDSKLIEDLYVFEPGKNFLNEYLHKNLGRLVLESDVDWTLYMSDKLYDILSSNNK